MSQETTLRANSTGRLESSSGRARSFLFAAGLMLVTLLVYWPCMQGAMTWDDDRYITRLRVVTEPDGIYKIWTQLSALPDAYPLTITAFWAQYRLWGHDPFGYHLVNVILHGFAALAGWALLRRLGLRTAWVAALIFAVHPVNVESVAWITELKNILSLLLGLLATLAYLRFAGIGDEVAALRSPTNRWSNYASGLLLFALALLYKSVICTLPVILALLIWFKRPTDWKRHTLYLLPWLAVAAGIAAMTAYVEYHHTREALFLGDITVIQRIGMAFHALAFYLGKLIVPDPILVIYPKWDHAAQAAQIPYALIILALLAAAFLAIKTFGRGPLTALLIYVVALSPTLGLISFFTMWYSFVFDHFQYIGTLAIIALACEMVYAAMMWLQNRMPTDQQRIARYLPMATTTIVALILASLTYGYAALWGFPEALWRFTADQNRQAFIAYQNLALHMTIRKNIERSEPLNVRYQEPIALLLRAIEIEPRDERLYFSVAQLYSWSGDYASATALHRAGQEKLRQRRNAVANDEESPDGASVDFGQPLQAGNSLERLGDFAGAVERYQDAVKTNPTNIQAHMGLGRCYAAAGNFPSAIASLTTALAQDPQDKEAWRLLALVYQASGKLQLAAEAEAKAR